MNPNSQEIDTNAEKIFQLEKTIFLPLVLGISLMALFFVFMYNQDKEVVFRWDDPMFIGLVAFLMLAILKLSDLLVKSLRNKNSENSIFTSFVVDMALFELIALLSNVFFHLTSNYAFLLITTVCIVVMISKRPRLDIIKEQVAALQKDEKRKSDGA